MQTIADPEAAADLPADDAGVHELLHPTAQHSPFLRLTATAEGTISQWRNLLSSLTEVDGVSTETAADFAADVQTLDGSDRTATTVFPTNSPAIVEGIYGPL